MPASQDTFLNNSKFIFVSSLFVSLFWLAGIFMNIYNNKAAGAIFEILWLPMIGMVFLLTFLSIKNWLQQKFRIKSLNLVSILIITATALLIICQ